MASNINEYVFVFLVKSPHFDDEGQLKGKFHRSQPITLGEILEYGQSTELEFTDGSYIVAKEIDWKTDTVEIKLCKP